MAELNNQQKLAIQAVLEIDEKKSVSRITSQLKNISKQIQDKNKIKIGIELDDSLPAKFQKLAASTVKPLLSEVKGAQNELAKLAGLSSLENFGDKNDGARGSKELLAAYQQLHKLLSNREPIENYSREIAEFKEKVEAAAGAGVTLSGVVSDIANRFSSRFLNENFLIDVFQKIVQNVVELDSAMTELRRSAGGSGGQFTQFLERAYQRAAELNVSVSELVKASAGFSRLGYSLGEAGQLAETAAIFANVGEDTGETGDAIRSITSTMEAFGVAAENSMSVVDKFNSVGGEFAITSGGIGQALVRSAASLSAAGNTLDESIGLIAAANAAVRNPEAVGSAFQTIAARLQGARTELEAAGGDVAGMAQSVSRLRQELLTLSGIDVMEDGGALKSTYQLLDELSRKWGELSEVQRSSITGLAAGTEQSGVFSALMQDFDTAREAADTSLHSAGSAMREYEIWTDSAEAKQQKFAAQFQEFSNAIVSSDLVKGTLDMGTGILGFLTTLIDRLETIPALATAAGAALSFKNVGWLKMQSCLNMPNHFLRAAA